MAQRSKPKNFVPFEPMNILNKIREPIPHSSFQHKSGQKPCDGPRITKRDITKIIFFSSTSQNLRHAKGRDTVGQYLSHFALQFPIQTFFNTKTRSPTKVFEYRRLPLCNLIQNAPKSTEFSATHRYQISLNVVTWFEFFYTFEQTEHHGEIQRVLFTQAFRQTCAHIPVLRVRNLF